MTACEWLDESCPDGYWRRRAGAACEPLPVLDAGTDAGSAPADSGPPDAGSTPDAASTADAGTDAATASDGAVPRDGAADAAADGSADAS